MSHRFRSALAGVAVALLLSTAGLAAPPEPTARDLETLALMKQPNDWFAQRLKAPPETADGQTLHPKIQYYLENVTRASDANGRRAQLAKALETPEARAAMRLSIDRTWNYRTRETVPMAAVEDIAIQGPAGPLAARVYVPAGKGAGPLPVLVYFHGGAWMFGSIDAIDRAARLIAEEAGVIVVSGSYRYTPEAKFPAPLDDAQAIFRWVRDNAATLGGDPSRIGIGGDSAGGHMAVVTSLRARAAGEKGPAYQLLYYPPLDMRTDYPSYRQFANGYGLDATLAEMVFATFFARPEDMDLPEASPLRQADLSGLPPTIIATAGFDILRDQGKLFADRLARAGVAVIHRNYGSLNHGFMQFSGVIDDAETACVETARLFGDGIRSAN